MTSCLVAAIETTHSPESLAEAVRAEPGVVLLRTGTFDSPQSRYSFLAVRPFLTFRSFGARCELRAGQDRFVQFGNPWRILEGLLARYELLDQWDLPFPLGGAFGYWGYELKNFLEPRLPRRAADDLELPESHVGFYDSLVVFDHLLRKTWVISTGLGLDGSRNPQRARDQAELWRRRLCQPSKRGQPGSLGGQLNGAIPGASKPAARGLTWPQQRVGTPRSSLSREEFLRRVERVLAYIRSGDIYQVNLSQRLCVPLSGSGWELFRCLTAASPAPFSAYLDARDFQLVSSSPELFLQLSGRQILTRPIKGTKPRSADPDRDAQLARELLTSRKERAELVMITDLLRNDLGKVSEYGSIHVPELVRLERYSHVQHLVSTVQGRLRPEVTHLAALASCFPGGSITGAPKIRAMEIIDELEPYSRGPYTGALGYLGFNHESQLSIIIRTAICRGAEAFFHVGAGIVSDSEPVAEYDETLAKAGGFLQVLASVEAPA